MWQRLWHLSVTIKRLTRYKQQVVLAAMLEGKSISFPDLAAAGNRACKQGSCAKIKPNNQAPHLRLQAHYSEQHGFYNSTLDLTIILRTIFWRNFLCSQTSAGYDNLFIRQMLVTNNTLFQIQQSPSTFQVDLLFFRILHVLLKCAPHLPQKS